jgi:hypothetical protein
VHHEGTIVPRDVSATCSLSMRNKTDESEPYLDL